MHAAGYAWVPLNLTGKSSFEVPEETVLGGAENGQPTFVGRVMHDDHWEVAKLNSWGKFGFGYFGREYELTRGEVLVALDQQVRVVLCSHMSRREYGIAAWPYHKAVESVCVLLSF